MIGGETETIPSKAATTGDWEQHPGKCSESVPSKRS